MSHSHNLRRFRINPVEIGIFSIISMIFIHSVYNLLYNNSGFHPSTLIPMSSNPISEGRSLASVSRNLSTLNLDCNDQNKMTVSGNKVRLSGQICGLSTSTENELITANITNQSNSFQATLFTDAKESRFSTDYIPLVTGENQVHIEFSYSQNKADRKTFTRDLLIQR